ncbi:hypothetical protein [Mesorhizobium sp.]|uniref:hypothetical protein n=1 Tax=Mesorhizobium sp. TaxID=1871066 RepID=UPI0025DD5D40|nr:hypothetical protein [Mesorhizobium sp.]
MACLSADERKPHEGEGFRLAEPALLASGRRKATEFNQPGLVRMERQFELLQPRAHRNEETASVVLVLEAERRVDWLDRAYKGPGQFKAPMDIHPDGARARSCPAGSSRVRRFSSSQR